jgi:hypothetical protein
MKQTLLRALTVVTLTLLSLTFAKAQTIKVKDNINQQIIHIKIQFERVDGVWEDAVGNYSVPSNSKRLKLKIKLRSTTQSAIKYKLELRQQCKVLINNQIDRSRELRFFASRTPLIGSTESEAQPPAPNGEPRVFDLVVTTHPPDSNPTQGDDHCGELDHLGEGPYQALIHVSDGSTLLDGQDALRLTYTQQFMSVPPDEILTLRLIEEMERDPKLKLKLQPKSPPKQRRSK